MGWVEGLYPVVDQGQRPIAGYTNDQSLLIEIPGPVIVFGDHTKAIKHIDFDFVAGADGTKILRPVFQDEKFFAFQLRGFDLEDRGYARHFKVLNAQLYALPPLAEQSRIVTRVEELMRLCDALEAKGQLEATQHAQLVSTLLGTLTASTTPEELAENWQRVAQHFDLLLDRPEAIDALEQTLLQLAVRGLLVPQDPTDEPASALLQRIRTEKDRLIATGQIKRDKPLPPITDEEKPFGLPVGWEWVRFGEYFFELCTGPFGSVIHKEDYVEDGIPLINPSHMIGGRISHDPSVSVSQEMSKQLGAYRLTVGDVVLARRGEVGRYALVTEAEDGWLCGTGSFFVKFQESCNREFFGLVLEDPDLRRHLQGESVGSTMVNLNQRILLETPMALPPLAEQSRIVTRVTALRRLCADLRQRLAEREAVQARLAEALVHEVSSV
jgi:type I restriction enzyme S subunit